MIDFNASHSRRAVDALHEGRTRALLLRFAMLFTSSEAAAEDLLSDAIILVCDLEERPWNEARGSFLAHMRVVVRDLARADRRSARARREQLDTDAVQRAPDTMTPGPEDAASASREVQRLRQMGARLREIIAPTARTLQVFDSACKGADAAETADRLGCTVDEVYNSNEQIAYHAAKVLAWQREAEEASMKARREGAKDKRTS